jgi:hypothetical protein
VPVEGEDQLDALVEAVVGERVEPVAGESETTKAGRQIGYPRDPAGVEMEGGGGGLIEQGQSSSS